jgi:hypothetical protein
MTRWRGAISQLQTGRRKVARTQLLGGVETLQFFRTWKRTSIFLSLGVSISDEIPLSWSAALQRLLGIGCCVGAVMFRASKRISSNPARVVIPSNQVNLHLRHKVLDCSDGPATDARVVRRAEPHRRNLAIDSWNKCTRAARASPTDDGHCFADRSVWPIKLAGEAVQSLRWELTTPTKARST